MLFQVIKCLLGLTGNQGNSLAISLHACVHFCHIFEIVGPHMNKSTPFCTFCTVPVVKVLAVVRTDAELLHQLGHVGLISGFLYYVQGFFTPFPLCPQNLCSVCPHLLNPSPFLCGRHILFCKYISAIRRRCAIHAATLSQSCAKPRILEPDSILAEKSIQRLTKSRRRSNIPIPFYYTLRRLFIRKVLSTRIRGVPPACLGSRQLQQRPTGRDLPKFLLTKPCE